MAEKTKVKNLNRIMEDNTPFQILLLYFLHPLHCDT